jgi:hypothetical protein
LSQAPDTKPDAVVVVEKPVRIRVHVKLAESKVKVMQSHVWWHRNQQASGMRAVSTCSDARVLARAAHTPESAVIDAPTMSSAVPLT